MSSAHSPAPHGRGGAGVGVGELLVFGIQGQWTQPPRAEGAFFCALFPFFFAVLPDAITCVMHWGKGTRGAQYGGTL
eukprot:1702857-Rhodomonas_salina.1